MADNHTTRRGLPRYFTILPPGTHVGGDGFLLLNARSLERYASKWPTREDAISAAWEEARKVGEINDVTT